MPTCQKQGNLHLRARMIRAIRRFFEDHDYLEVETPYLVSESAPEIHIDAVKVGSRYLHTSPELCMKRLLCKGHKKIFQISKCFRAGERGRLHLPEFTLLEWYRVDVDYEALMQECEAMILRVSHDLGTGDRIYYNNNEILLRNTWERIRVNDAFLRHASITAAKALEKGLFDEIMVNKVEPRLGVERPTFIYDYPAPLASLARLKPGNPELAERFELYVGGVELANGFSELTDAAEQRKRFEEVLRQMQDAGKPPHPLPEEFLKCLEYMPEAAGAALGVDRLAMIFCNASEIDEVVAVTPDDV
jgi:lysyl-tRNA synthetase class 2